MHRGLQALEILPKLPYSGEIASNCCFHSTCPAVDWNGDDVRWMTNALTLPGGTRTTLVPGPHPFPPHQQGSLGRRDCCCRTTGKKLGGWGGRSSSCDAEMESVVLLFSEALRTATVAQSSESKKRQFHWSRVWLKGGCFTGKPMGSMGGRSESKKREGNLRDTQVPQYF